VALFAVSLTFLLKVDTPNPPEPMRELAIHLVFADNEREAHAKGTDIGRARETAYLNVDGLTVRDTFQGVVELQELQEKHLFDGMEVSSWLYKGDRLILDEGWTHRPSDAPG
jgi:hypothetical protein